MKSDLHLHTTASDGMLTPENLVKLALNKNLDVIAITDHDTVGGVLSALDTAKLLNSITVIPGVEINTDVPETEVHVLGYFIDFENKNLLDNLSELRSSREDRAKLMVEKLHNLGMHIKYSRLTELAEGGAIGRPHVAHALIEAGYVSAFQEAFDKYIGRGRPAYVAHKKMSPEEVVNLIRETGGIPVLAHPYNINDLENLIKKLLPAGLAGMEVHYGDYTENVINELLKIANRYNLIATGGSDYHAFNTEKETMIGDVNVPEESVIKLMSEAKIRNPHLISKFKILDNQD